MSTLQVSPVARRTLHVRRPVMTPPVVAMPQTPVEAEDKALSSVADARRFDDANLTITSLDSAALLCGQKTVQISHNGFVYKLQATKLGKLILTK